MASPSTHLIMNGITVEFTLADWQDFGPVLRHELPRNKINIVENDPAAAAAGFLLYFLGRPTRPRTEISTAGVCAIFVGVSRPNAEAKRVPPADILKALATIDENSNLFSPLDPQRKERLLRLFAKVFPLLANPPDQATGPPVSSSARSVTTVELG